MWPHIESNLYQGTRHGSWCPVQSVVSALACRLDTRQSERKRESDVGERETERGKYTTFSCSHFTHKVDTYCHVFIRFLSLYLVQLQNKKYDTYHTLSTQVQVTILYVHVYACVLLLPSMSVCAFMCVRSYVCMCACVCRVCAH